MMKRNKLATGIVTTVCALAISACASKGPRADIASTANPQDEINRLDKDLKDAAANNVDVLAFKPYDKSIKALEDAKVDLAKGRKSEKTLDEIRLSRGYLDEANKEANGREEQAPGLFQARRAALDAGAAQKPQLQGDMLKVDKDVRGKTDNLSKVSTAKIAEYQAAYLDLQKRAVILTQLGSAQAKLDAARHDKAEKRAPATYKKAQLSITTAENAIATNINNPDGYKNEVAIANANATLLSEVMTAITQNGKKLSEATALKMVSQNHQIKNLKTDLSVTEQEDAAMAASLREKNDQLAADLDSKEDALASKNKDLSAAKAQVAMQAAIEKARQQFSADEAEAFQQGDKLVIRLKNVGFASGRSDLPANSMPILAKVSDVAKSLDASEIQVEGHTDSTGSKAINQTISQKRADAVASYLKTNGFKDIDVESTGYGFEKPIASNKSAQGRAENRRVDVIITPDASSQGSTTQGTTHDPSME